MSTVKPQYWQVNVPADEWTEECPTFLKGLPKKDVDILSITDAEFREKRLTMDWEEVKEIVKTRRIDRFRRLPSHLRRYKAFRHALQGTYGGVMPFVLQTRLRWAQPVTPRGAPFQFADDVKILYNDWPYEISSDIVHLVVWTKFALEEDPQTTILTEGAHAKVEEFVTRTFRTKLPEDHVIWFRNTADLRSIHAIEHFHVMLYRPDPDFLRQITHGDVPLISQFNPGYEKKPE